MSKSEILSMEQVEFETHKVINTEEIEFGLDRLEEILKMWHKEQPEDFEGMLETEIYKFKNKIRKSVR